MINITQDGGPPHKRTVTSGLFISLLYLCYYLKIYIYICMCKTVFFLSCKKTDFSYTYVDHYWGKSSFIVLLGYLLGNRVTELTK